MVGWWDGGVSLLHRQLPLQPNSSVTLPNLHPQGQGSTTIQTQKKVLQTPQSSQVPNSTMPYRASSPTGSEFEFDISNALADGDFLSDDENAGSRKVSTAANDQNINDILDASDDDGDEAFIAAQQAASNRKGSNLKGKTVKKGGGFQQMGLFYDYFYHSDLGAND